MIKKKKIEIFNLGREEMDIDDIYGGILEFLNKMRSSCKKRDILSLSYEASELQLMTAQLIAFLEKTIDRGEHYVPFSITGRNYLEQEIPELSNLITRSDFDEIANSIEIFEKKIDLYMKDKSAIEKIPDFNGLKDAIIKRINNQKEKLQKSK